MSQLKVNSLQEMVDLARAVRGLRKEAFVDSATAMGGGGGMPPGMDPSMMGGAPPMDPSMMGGAPPMDPSMMGGAPPAAPPPSGGGGGDDMLSQIMQRLDKIEQGQSSGGGSPAAGGAGGSAKVKVDTNAVMLQILKIVARLAEAQGVSISPSDMIPTGTEIDQLAQMSQTGDYSSLTGGGGGGGGQPGGAIGSIQPIDPAYLNAGGGQKQSADFGMAFPETSNQTGAAMQSMAAKAKAIASKIRR